jgi:hypothetical protein
MTITKTIVNDFAFGGRPEQPRMKLLGFKPFPKSTLRGFIDVELGIGLQIVGLTLHLTNGHAWVGLPSKPILNEEGRHVAGADGKRPYAAILSWRDRKLGDAFGKQVIALVVAEHPDALDGGE